MGTMLFAAGNTAVTTGMRATCSLCDWTSENVRKSPWLIAAEGEDHLEGTHPGKIAELSAAGKLFDGSQIPGIVNGLIQIKYEVTDSRPLNKR